MHSTSKRLWLYITIFLSLVALTSCKGEDAVLGEDPTPEDGGERILDQYIVTELDLEDVFDPQSIQVDAERGVIFVPQGGLGEEGAQGLPHLVELDLASGLPLKSYGIISRLPSKHVVVSSTGNAVASVLEWSTQRSEISIQPLNDQAGSGFDVDFLIEEIKFDDHYFFALNDDRNQVHQYNVVTGEHLGQIDGLSIDDWLITHGTNKLYVLSNSEVTEYDFSRGAIVSNGKTFPLSNTATGFGWLSPDETHLYQSNGEVLAVPKFETLSPELISLSNARRFFVDIGFNPNSDKHYTIESYSGIDGDVFLSPLVKHEAEPLGIVGRRVFASSAGVHLYAYEDGEHKLYTLQQSDEKAYESGEINIAPRLTLSAFNAFHYAAHLAIYPVGLYSEAWSELYLRLDVVNMRDYYKSDQIIIEPICINDSCASGSYSAEIPLERQPMHFTVHLKDWFQVNDFRGLAGFRVRTPEGYWDSFQLQNVLLSNINPAACADVVDTNVLAFCDD